MKKTQHRIMEMAESTDRSKIIKYFQEKKIFLETRICPKCSRVMSLDFRDDVEDKYRFRCKCNKSCALRLNTFFENTRISLHHIFGVLWDTTLT
jgi:hypothetical protein